jgi:hypothetical protein
VKAHGKAPRSQHSVQTPSRAAVAFQVCWKLWSARWNRSGEYRRPRILYLADRNILVDQPKDGIFAVFGDARHKIEGGQVVLSREMYFAIYQALAEDERRQGLFRSYPPDFFDLVIVDECHRGSPPAAGSASGEASSSQDLVAPAKVGLPALSARRHAGRIFFKDASSIIHPCPMRLFLDTSSMVQVWQM